MALSPLPMLTAITLAAAAPTAAFAQAGFQDLAALDSAIADALAAPVGTPGGARAIVDRRLRLAVCPTPVDIQPMADAVAVRCPAAGWRIRVPTMADGLDATLLPSATATPSQPLRAEPLIRRGDAVEMVMRGRGFSVRMRGIAEQAGAIGDIIR
ncbi:MAG: flagella basal body P-ring formation protein FlgA, partial [Sphingopyxis sp.]|nr:flagella basal body P-ring formation protein FlgA [Sphingopyxis sp.]